MKLNKAQCPHQTISAAVLIDINETVVHLEGRFKKKGEIEKEIDRNRGLISIKALCVELHLIRHCEHLAVARFNLRHIIHRPILTAL